jgi:hypothetical protein
VGKRYRAGTISNEDVRGLREIKNTKSGIGMNSDGIPESASKRQRKRRLVREKKAPSLTHPTREEVSKIVVKKNGWKSKKKKKEASH